MATLPVIRYPLDPTGLSVDNLVQAEPHAMARRRQRVIAPLYGAFFTESLVVRDGTTNAVLVKGVQYYAAELYELPTARYGKEICAIIIITDESVSDSVTVTYQALGGEFSASAEAVKQQIDALSLDDRPVQWGSIVMKPSEYPPSHHLHDLGDVFGFEYVVHALDRIRAAIELGDAASHDQIFHYIDQLGDVLNNADLLTQQSLASHRDNFANPHNVNAAQVGTYTSAVIDGKIATALQGFTTHIGDFENPHQVTALQLNVFTKAESYSQTQVNELVSTAIQTFNTAIAPQITALNAGLNAHVAAQGNPHNLTPAILGVYSKAESDSRYVLSGGGGGGGTTYLPPTSFGGGDGWERIQMPSAFGGQMSVWNWTAPPGSKGFLAAQPVSTPFNGAGGTGINGVPSLDVYKNSVKVFDLVAGPAVLDSDRTTNIQLQQPVGFIAGDQIQVVAGVNSNGQGPIVNIFYL